MSRNLRVVHLAKHAPPVRGGIETVVLRRCRTLTTVASAPLSIAMRART